MCVALKDVLRFGCGRQLDQAQNLEETEQMRQYYFDNSNGSPTIWCQFELGVRWT